MPYNALGTYLRISSVLNGPGGLGTPITPIGTPSFMSMAAAGLNTSVTPYIDMAFAGLNINPYASAMTYALNQPGQTDLAAISQLAALAPAMGGLDFGQANGLLKKTIQQDPLFKNLPPQPPPQKGGKIQEANLKKQPNNGQKKADAKK